MPFIRRVEIQMRFFLLRKMFKILFLKFPAKIKYNHPSSPPRRKLIGSAKDNTPLPNMKILTTLKDKLIDSC